MKNEYFIMFNRTRQIEPMHNESMYRYWVRTWCAHTRYEGTDRRVQTTTPIEMEEKKCVKMPKREHVRRPSTTQRDIT